MWDQGSFYLQSAQKILQSERQLVEVEEESVEDMLRFLTTVDLENKPEEDAHLFVLNQRMKGQSSPVRMFAKEKYESLGVMESAQLSNLQSRLDDETLEYRLRERQNRLDHSRVNKEIVDALNEYDEIQHCQLPVEDIIRECQSFPYYIDLAPPVHQVHSSPSFDDSTKKSFKVEVFQPLVRPKQPQLNTQTMELEFEETEDILDQQLEEETLQKLTNILHKHPRFLKLFGTYIKYFIKAEVDKDDNFAITEDTASMVYQQFTVDPPRLQSLKDSQNQEFLRPIHLDELKLPLYTPDKLMVSPPPLFQKLANKRNGESIKFHPKTFILTGEQLVYYGEDSNTKMVVVKPQVLRLTRVEKELGGFFSREKRETQVFKIEGENKAIEIQYSQLEGSEIFRMMVEHFALKLYQIYCISTETVENQFHKFLLNASSRVWDFTQMKVVERVPLAQFLPFWFAGLPFKHNLREISFRNCQMAPTTTEYILRMIHSNLHQPLKELDISGNQLLEDGIREYCNCLKRFQGVTKIQLHGCDLNSYYIELLANELQNFGRPLELLDVGGNPLANMFMTSKNLLNVIDRCRPNILKLNDGQLRSEDLVNLSNFRYDIIELEANNCGLEISDTVVKNLMVNIERNYKLKALRAIGNVVTASNESLLELIKRPQLNEIAIDFSPDFFTDIKDPDHDWVIVPL